MWIRWIQEYYVKGQDLWQIECPSQAAWVVQKIFAMRKYKPLIGSWDQVLNRDKFMIRKAYKCLRGSHDKVVWKSITCDNNGTPKAMFIAWMALWGKLRTRDIVSKWGVTTDTMCVLCDQADETIEHIFFDYPYSKNIWHTILQWIRTDHLPMKWAEEVKWVAQKSRSKSAFAKTIKLVFVTSIYHVWLERNERVFGK